jgi:hypothetical protein
MSEEPDFFEAIDKIISEENREEFEEEKRELSDAIYNSEGGDQPMTI